MVDNHEVVQKDTKEEPKNRSYLRNLSIPDKREIISDSLKVRVLKIVEGYQKVLSKIDSYIDIELPTIRET